ncbi:ATP-binding protein [Actinomadura rubrobrunea]|uniref:ATP-binding protein n=1 Tax=Actinomadura rubrobrunea TaxID=115335 RepID=A0A9W6UWA8_9ACTN|nr:ATP-binding protein [Actinomadura rubrobrunea]GLW64082.1 ATP-binding protein [Actinomadura rubrobrunea]
MSMWPHQRQVTLIALPNAPYWARRHTEAILNEWRVRAVAADAALVVTELVTNAVKATGLLDAAAYQDYALRPQSVPYAKLVAAGVVRLRLSHSPGRLLVEVWDRCDDPPDEQLPDFVSEGGRGLFIVGAYCEKWGWYPAQGGGKVVWAELAAP